MSFDNDQRMPFVIRHAKQEDQNLIYNAWLKGTKKSFAAKRIPSDLFYHVHAQVITDLLPTTKILVAANPEDPSHIYGFLAYAPIYVHRKFLMHYLYVKEPYRQLGIATALRDKMLDDELTDIPCDSPLIASHLTEEGRNFLRSWRLIYNPYVLWKGIYGIAKIS